MEAAFALPESDPNVVMSGDLKPGVAAELAPLFDFMRKVGSLCRVFWYFVHNVRNENADDFCFLLLRPTPKVRVNEEGSISSMLDSLRALPSRRTTPDVSSR